MMTVTRLVIHLVIGLLCGAIWPPVAGCDEAIAAERRQWEFPYVRTLRPNQHFYIQGQKQDKISVVLRENPRTLYVNDLFVCTDRREPDTASAAASPQARSFVEDLYSQVPFVVRQIERGTATGKAIDLCTARQDSLLTLVDSLASRYAAGLADDADVAVQSARILNELGFRDVCESIVAADGELLVQLYCDLTEMSLEIVGSLCPVRPEGGGPQVVHAQYDAESICAFFSTNSEVPSLCVVSGGGLFHYLLGEVFVDDALGQIAAAERGEATAGRLDAAFLADFFPRD